MAKELSTKAHLLNIASHLFAERGFEGVSVRDIAKTAKVNLGAVNYHFKSKEELYMAVFRDRLGGVHEIFEIFEKNFESEPSKVIPKFAEDFTTYVLVKNQHMVPMVLRELSMQNSKHLDIIAHEILGPNFKILISYLKHHMEQGKLLPCDPMKCAVTLISLCLFPAHMKPVMLRIGNADPSKPENALAMAKHNSDVFLRAFDPQKTRGGSK